LLDGERIPLVPPDRWGDTRLELPEPLAGHRWHNVVTGEVLPARSRLAVGEVLQRFPVAVLASNGPR